MVEAVFDVSFEGYGGVARFGHGVVEVAFSGLKRHVLSLTGGLLIA